MNVIKDKIRRHSALGVVIVLSMAIYVLALTNEFQEAYIHLFYIPIMIASVRLEKNGLVVPLILALALICGHLFFQQRIPMRVQLIRYVAFATVGYVTFRIYKRMVESENEVKTSRNLLEVCLERSPIPTFVIDTRHRVTLWNRSLEALSGIPKRDMIGTRKHWKAFYRKKRPCLADIMLDRRMDEMNSLYKGKACESRLIRDAFEAQDFFSDLGEDGRWLRFTASVLRDSREMLIGAMQTLEDITERIRADEALKASERRYKELSITDGLTGLYNARHFFNQMSSEIDRVNRYNQQLSMLMIDIDDFKSYNDAFGHLEGDNVLLRLGQVLMRCQRATDTSYRYGGEEFTLIMPGTAGTAALKLAKRVQEEFAKEKFFPPDHKKPIYKTVSIGVAQYIYSEVLSDFVRRADQNMYKAKSDGKNRVCYSR